jgi:hypothetical protein
MGSHMSIRVRLLSALFVCLCALSVFSASAGASVTCDRYASPSGSDSSGNGSSASPYATLAKLDSALSPGQTGCLEAGTYGDVNTWHDLLNSGTASGEITLTAAPGAQVTVVGWITIEGSYTTITGLNIDDSNTFSSGGGSGCPSPASEGLFIKGPDNTLEDNNIYQSVASLRGNLIGIGWDGQPDNTIIRYNRIHDGGGCLAYDHIIYLSHGNNVQIYDNWLWNDPHGWGIQVYPGPNNARIFDNVIDHAGSGLVIADDGGGTTNNNEAYNNVVINSVGINNGNSYAGDLVNSPGLTGTGNQVFNNDSYNNPGGISNINSSVSSANLSVSNNVTSNPQFVDPTNHNYQLQSGSPLASWGLWDGSAGGGSAPPPPAAPADTTAPSVSGNAAVGATLTCANGTWTGSPTSVAYAWLSNGTTIANATSQTYTTTSTDAGHSISCAVTATNAGGSTSANSSNSIAIPTPPPPPPPAAPAPGRNLALGMPATASSSANSSSGPAMADDGNTSTDWESAVSSKSQWWHVDLGTVQAIGGVNVYWGSPSASSYRIQVYTNGKWRTVATVTAGGSGWHGNTFTSVSTRYVRILATPGTSSQVAIGEVQVFAPGVTFGVRRVKGHRANPNRGGGRHERHRASHRIRH